jgi:anion-transporting  ArsA/GET3 family ATPase
MPTDDDKHNPDGWTFATLYKHVMEISNANKEATAIAMASSEKAILKAENATDKRLELLNELKGAMKDREVSFADKEQTDFRLTAIDKKLAEQGGKSQGIGLVAIIITQTILIIVGLGGLAVALLRAH